MSVRENKVTGGYGQTAQFDHRSTYSASYNRQPDQLTWHDTKKVETTVDNNWKKIGPYANGVKNANFIAPHARSNFSLGKIPVEVKHDLASSVVSVDRNKDIYKREINQIYRTNVNRRRSSASNKASLGLTTNPLKIEENEQPRYSSIRRSEPQVEETKQIEDHQISPIFEKGTSKVETIDNVTPTELKKEILRQLSLGSIPDEALLCANCFNNCCKKHRSYLPSYENFDGNGFDFNDLMKRAHRKIIEDKLETHERLCTEVNQANDKFNSTRKQNFINTMENGDNNIYDKKREPMIERNRKKLEERDKLVEKYVAKFFNDSNNRVSDYYRKRVDNVKDEAIDEARITAERFRRMQGYTNFLKSQMSTANEEKAKIKFESELKEKEAIERNLKDFEKFEKETAEKRNKLRSAFKVQNEELTKIKNDAVGVNF